MALMLEVSEHLHTKGGFVPAAALFPLSIVHVSQYLGLDQSGLVVLFHLCTESKESSAHPFVAFDYTR